MAVFRHRSIGPGTPVSTAMLSGYGWAGGRITYSSPDTAADHGSGYSRDYDGDGRSAQSDGFAALSSAQFAAVRGALDAGATAGGAASRSRASPASRSRYAGAGSGAGDMRVAQHRGRPHLLRLRPGPRHGRRRLVRRVGARAAGGQLRPPDHAARGRPRARAQARATRAGGSAARPGLRLAGVHGDDLPRLGGGARRPATTSRSGARRRPT